MAKTMENSDWESQPKTSIKAKLQDRELLDKLSALPEAPETDRIKITKGLIKFLSARQSSLEQVCRKYQILQNLYTSTSYVDAVTLDFYETVVVLVKERKRKRSGDRCKTEEGNIDTVSEVTGHFGP